MKILHLISGGDVGGAKTHVFLLLEGLAKLHTVRLVCFTGGSFAEEATSLGIPTEIIDTGIRATVSRLKKMVDEEHYEIIHCHGARANMIGALLKRKTGLPTVTTMHSDYRRDYIGRPLAAVTYGTINKIALRRLDNWIGVSDATSAMLVSRNFAPDHVFKLYNSVRFTDAPPKLSRDEFLEKYHISAEPDSVLFGIAARISPVKDMETLVRGFAQTVSEYPSVRLLIAGDGESRESVERLAGSLCPAGSVIFCGWLDDVDSFYNAIDVNMLTSVSEGFPFSLPEGAKRHCPAIASKVGGVPEIIDHGVNGFLFTPKDEAALAKYMRRLAGDPELREKMSVRMYEKAKREFSLDAMLKRQTEIYTAILRRRRLEQTGAKNGIVVCGAYGKCNCGDEAILSVIVERLRRQRSDIPITVISRSPKSTRDTYRVNAVHTFRFLKIRRVMRGNALYLSGGGSLIQDATSTRSLLYYLNGLRSAKKRGCAVVMFACGIGPVYKKKNRIRAGSIIEKYVDRILLRDAVSAEELKKLGVTNVPVTVTADIAMLLPPANPTETASIRAESGLSDDARYLLIAPRPWGTTNVAAAIHDAARHAWENSGIVPVLFAMEPRRDHTLCDSIARTLRAENIPAVEIDAPEDPRITVGLIHGAAAVLSMRLHALIFSAAGCVPYAAISYDPKVTGFLKDMHNGNSCSLEDCTSERLCSMLDAILRSAAPEPPVSQLALAEQNFPEIAGYIL